MNNLKLGCLVEKKQVRVSLPIDLIEFRDNHFYGNFNVLVEIALRYFLSSYTGREFLKRSKDL